MGLNSDGSVIEDGILRHCASMDATVAGAASVGVSLASSEQKPLWD